MHSLRKTVPATELPVSLETVKAHLRVTWDDDDDLISGMMLRVAEEIEAGCGIPMGVATFAETVDEFPCNHITISRRPVVSVDSVAYWDIHGVQQTLDPAAYYSALQTGRLLPNCTWPCTQWNRPEAVEITFTAGASDNLPPQAVSAFLLTMANRFTLRGEATTNTSAGTDTLSLPPAAVMLLRQLWRGDI
ncbi:head-tail connector protein [Zavarzinella formosa]|uniref:head-tail connector protein n=1 Tax=Zavarzinella formosa TaxID=360055 RepID=UPI0002EF423E|nr:phage head-tail connector protein [Zavarzinella formosa]